MKRILVGYFLITILFHNIHCMIPSISTPESRQQKRNQLAFAYACQENELGQLGYLFTDGSTDLNYFYKDSQDIERPQLSIAARKYTYPVITGNGNHYDPDVINWLIQNGADLNTLDKTGRSAALWSIGSYQGENEHPIALFLHTKKIDINQIFTVTPIDDFFERYRPQVTLLTAAVLNNWEVFGFPQARYNLVRTLLKFKPNRNVAPGGKTALQIAEELGDQEMVTILEEK